MPRFKSIISRIVFLHVVAVVITSILMSLALSWLLSYATDNIHHKAMQEQAVAVGELLAQAMDVDLDRVGGDLAGMSEDVILDLLLGDHAALAAHQQFEHRGLACRQHLWLVVDRGLAVLRVEGEVGDLQARAEQLARAAQLRFEPRDQFLQRERLHQIVVGAAAQALHTIVQAAPRGQHQHGRRVLAMAQLAQDREAVSVGQTEIENDGRIGRGHQHGARFGRGRKQIDLVASRPQALGEQLGQQRIVFDNQQTHRVAIQWCGAD